MMQEPSSDPEGVEFMQDLECPLIVRDGEESSATWLEYVYLTAHSALLWLPTKLAEWIGENMQDELGFADKADKLAAICFEGAAISTRSTRGCGGLGAASPLAAFGACRSIRLRRGRMLSAAMRGASVQPRQNGLARRFQPDSK